MFSFIIWYAIGILGNLVLLNETVNYVLSEIDMVEFLKKSNPYPQIVVYIYVGLSLLTLPISCIMYLIRDKIVDDIRNKFNL